jgi:hypothetical protein
MTSCSGKLARAKPCRQAHTREMPVRALRCRHAWLSIFVKHSVLEILFAGIAVTASPLQREEKRISWPSSGNVCRAIQSKSRFSKLHHVDGLPDNSVEFLCTSCSPIPRFCTLWLKPQTTCSRHEKFVHWTTKSLICFRRSRLEEVGG